MLLVCCTYKVYENQAYKVEAKIAGLKFRVWKSLGIIKVVMSLQVYRSYSELTHDRPHPPTTTTKCKIVKG